MLHRGHTHPINTGFNLIVRASSTQRIVPFVQLLGDGLAKTSIPREILVAVQVC